MRVRLIEVESHNRYKMAGEVTAREQRKERERNRREERRAKYSENIAFVSHQINARGGR